MKFSAQEEYGLRCLLQIGRQGEGNLNIHEISSAEGLSVPYVAKLMRILRRGGFVQSTRGQAGGYVLSRPPEQIVIGEVLALLGGRFYEPDFCERYPGSEEICTHTVNCSVRSLWSAVQVVVDRVLSKTTLQGLLGNEQQTFSLVSNLVQLEEIPSKPPIC